MTKNRKLVLRLLTKLKGWRKNTQAVIAENEAFFGNLADVTDVYVLGHSMAEVDLPYFERVRDVVNEGSHGISLFMVSIGTGSEPIEFA